MSEFVYNTVAALDLALWSCSFGLLILVSIVLLLLALGRFRS